MRKLILPVVMVFLASCGGSHKTPTLLTSDIWVSDTLSSGLVYHNYTGYDEISKAMQIVNVMEVDLDNPAYVVDFEYTMRDSTSSVMVDCEKKTGKKAWAAINAGYENEAIYVRVDNETYHTVDLAPDHLRFWKHEAAFCSNGDRDVSIVYAGADGQKAIEYYNNLQAENIIASAPMLINDYDPMGERYVEQQYQEDPSVLYDLFEYEHPQRHQGVRHPRVVYALTEDNDLLLIVIDGRWKDRCEGMSATETTRFIAKHFNPRWAINMDGGGSATLCVEGHGEESTNVVNYPASSRDKVFDHFFLRRVPTHIVIREK